MDYIYIFRYNHHCCPPVLSWLSSYSWLFICVFLHLEGYSQPRETFESRILLLQAWISMLVLSNLSTHPLLLFILLPNLFFFFFSFCRLSFYQLQTLKSSVQLIVPVIPLKVTSLHLGDAPITWDFLMLPNESSNNRKLSLSSFHKNGGFEKLNISRSHS